MSLKDYVLAVQLHEINSTLTLLMKTDAVRMSDNNQLVNRKNVPTIY